MHEMEEGNVQVVCPLVSFLTALPAKHPFRLVGDIAIAKAGKTIICATSTMEQEPLSSTTTMSKRPREDSGSKVLTVRQAMQEMRASIESLTCDTVLSSGERVGEFLLRQWISKERPKPGAPQSS